MAIRTLQVDVSTGDDDFRSGSQASVALVGEDLSGRLVDLRVVPLNDPGEKFGDRTSKRLVHDLPPPGIELSTIEFVELRFIADRGPGDDKWHCRAIRVTGNPDGADRVDLWSHESSRDDRLSRHDPVRRSLRLPTWVRDAPQLDVEMTTGDDDLRSDSGGFVEIELAQGELLHGSFMGEFRHHTTHSVRFDMVDELEAAPGGRRVNPVHRVRLFFGSALGTGFESLPQAIRRELSTNDEWDLERLRLRSSRGTTLLEAGPLRLRRRSVWESDVMAPKDLRATEGSEFGVELLTGRDDLRTSTMPRSEVDVALVLRGGEEVPLRTRTRRDQPFVAASARDGGVYVGTFASWGGARATGRTDGRTVRLADIERVAVRMRLGVLDPGHVVGTSLLDPRAGDRWSLAGVRLFTFDGRHLASFLDLDVTLDADHPTWVSPRGA